ncbi:pro-sigmaK processing inhibitor BofA family protein [Sporolactobacillus terrae]|uniref:Pro-sigmaK processing inhibitor BofA n=1 Tax=Sporolactobacillus terrae TaxID=269673 RepID=A0A410D510_9BACL|nr:pro-sigmaK processing inhibitor BofA family protein [Sporolactobacillus terrae]QAA21188.1 pro-sigmaK processing inhibitor BofA [Sporolactobacillus terrae]QAA24162.1 pro-sigmaK processing inhibitor BofA [Sporolactobacillus terrae]UAK15969.1 pro-sigmaK processing inhibitor BofA family protein [Sporolactobacillus terrae]BBN97325.1 pro-sigmaK processing inhibitor BofA [Sporolactobacillus terrae]
MSHYLFLVIGILVVFLIMIVAGTSAHPMRWIGKLAVRLVVGALLLFLLNVIGESFSMHIPINLATAAVSGFLGLPGLAALMIIKFSIGV